MKFGTGAPLVSRPLEIMYSRIGTKLSPACEKSLMTKRTH